MKSIKSRLLAIWVILTKKYYIVHGMNDDGKVKTRAFAPHEFMTEFSPKTVRQNKIATMDKRHHTTNQNKYN